MQRKLPPLYMERNSYAIDWYLQGLVVNQVNNTFQLVIVEMGTRDSRTLKTSVYDSVARSWDQKVQPFSFKLTEFKAFPSPPHGCVCHNGNLYISTYESPCIMSYDLATGLWSNFECPSEISSAVDLGCWNGRLYAISSRWRQCIGPPELHVHQLLEGTNKRWDEVCPIPLGLFNELFKTNNPSPAWNDCDDDLDYVQASFCDEYVLISVFLQDYLVLDSCCGGYKLWYGATLVPRRFALLNLETKKWELLDFPISKDRRRMKAGTEESGYAYRDKKRVEMMMKEMIKKKLKEREDWWR